MLISCVTVMFCPVGTSTVISAAVATVPWASDLYSQALYQRRSTSHKQAGCSCTYAALETTMLALADSSFTTVVSTATVAEELVKPRLLPRGAIAPSTVDGAKTP